MEPQPQWKRIETSKQGKQLANARQFAIYMHGRRWSEKHDRAVKAYLAEQLITIASLDRWHQVSESGKPLRRFCSWVLFPR